MIVIHALDPLSHGRILQRCMEGVVVSATGVHQVCYAECWFVHGKNTNNWLLN